MSAYRDPEPREAPGIPREPIAWASVGGWLVIGSALSLAADAASAGVLAMGTDHGPPDATRWIAVVCFAAFAVGLTVAACSKGKALPHL